MKKHRTSSCRTRSINNKNKQTKAKNCVPFFVLYSSIRFDQNRKKGFELSRKKREKGLNGIEIMSLKYTIASFFCFLFTKRRWRRKEN